MRMAMVGLTLLLLFPGWGGAHPQAEPAQQTVKSRGTVPSKDSKKPKQEAESAESAAIRGLVEEMRVQEQIETKNRQSETYRANQDIDIQWKLVRYTKWLALVGGLQFLALAGTAYIVCLQRNLMQVHAGHLKKLAIAAKRNASAAWANAEAIKESVVLQKTVKRQWVEFKDWRIESHKSYDTDEITLTIFFAIVNPTDMPLTLRFIELFKTGRTETVPLEYVLHPRAERQTDFGVIVRREDLLMYLSNQWVIHVFGRISFVDNFGDKRHTMLGEVCLGGKDNWSFSPFENWTPSDEWDE
jgi:hypothetical protein